MIARLRALLTASPGTVVLDPCCGTGEAVRALFPTATIYGIDLDDVRAAASPEEMAVLIKQSPIYPRPTPPPADAGRPPTRLRQGHVAMVLASGLINGCYGSPDDGSLHIAKGTVVRTEHKEFEPGETQSTELVTQSFSIMIRAMTPDGRIHSMMGGSPVSDEEES